VSLVDEAVVEDLADLYIVEKEVRSEPARERLGRMAERKTSAAKGLRKASAARMLGVSVNTLDKWVLRGRVPLIRDAKTGRLLVDVRAFVPIYVKVRALRAAGQADGLIAAAIGELEREDPEYQDAFSKLYGPSLEAVAEGRLKPLVVPNNFGPED
jgi:hypothetical protein